MSNILLISDDCRTTTGVAGQSAEIIKGLASKGHVLYQVSPHFQERPAQTILHKFPSGEEVVIYSTKNYDDVDVILSVITEQSIDAVILFTDPHKFQRVFQNYRAIRAQCPLIFYTIWDSWLVPDKDGKEHWNSWMYESCSYLACISKQTENFVNTIVNRLDTDNKPGVSYLSHGIDPNVFKPLPESETEPFRRHFFGEGKFDFVAIFNSRNQLRKKPIDIIYCWAKWANSLSVEQQKKVALILHTEPVAQTGTNLVECCQALAPRCNIFIDSPKRTPEQINRLYNICDIIIAPSNAEGWGLTPHEFVMAGGVSAVSVTGGLQDQCGFTNDKGEPMTFNEDCPSNTDGTFNRYCSWVYPMFGIAEIIGNPATPYLENTVVSHDDIIKAFDYWYNIPREERKRRGLEGRNYFIKAGLTNADMVNSFDKLITEAIQSPKVKLFEVYPS